jgi:hypothetical protein
MSNARNAKLLQEKAYDYVNFTGKPILFIKGILPYEEDELRMYLIHNAVWAEEQSNKYNRITVQDITMLFNEATRFDRGLFNTRLGILDMHVLTFFNSEVGKWNLFSKVD